jgi:RNA polymerase sigma factor (sigma-70 family)
MPPTSDEQFQALEETAYILTYNIFTDFLSKEEALNSAHRAVLNTMKSFTELPADVFELEEGASAGRPKDIFVGLLMNECKKMLNEKIQDRQIPAQDIAAAKPDPTALSKIEESTNSIVEANRAFTLVFQNVRRKIQNWAESKLQNKDNAAEVVQETAHNMWKYGSGFDSKREHQPWVDRIASNKIKDKLKESETVGLPKNAYKKGIRHQYIELDELLNHSSRVSVPSQSIYTDQLLSGLSEDHYRVVVLKHLDLEEVEIASQLGIKIKTVKSRYREARGNLMIMDLDSKGYTVQQIAQKLIIENLAETEAEVSSRLLSVQVYRMSNARKPYNQIAAKLGIPVKTVENILHNQFLTYLSEPHRQVLQLKYWGATETEIASEINLSVENVKNRIQHASEIIEIVRLKNQGYTDEQVALELKMEEAAVKRRFLCAEVCKRNHAGWSNDKIAAVLKIQRNFIEEILGKSRFR